ncbi:expressed protein [Dictyostelium purpureum]|uniref:Expressed protein n=1 Tax=Dictyostelium purpureum TaxID=5786 RepID=F0ZC10_DICPU|nr:uncharacterized protein DICPUDRAFT_96880 [Dictyostelium purpureum]EGC38512.1 expressed protein [Dictyostelium purpureum]|eukprot:XP_003284977.1 expressed protein [Dictyostelium purpureum]
MNFLKIVLIFIFLNINFFYNYNNAVVGVSSYLIGFDLKVNNRSYFGLNDTISTSFKEMSSKLSTFYLRFAQLQLSIYIFQDDQSDADQPLEINEDVYILGPFTRYSLIEVRVVNSNLESSKRKVIIDGLNAQSYFLSINSGFMKKVLIDGIVFRNWKTNIVSLKNFQSGTLEINNCEFINSKFVSIVWYNFAGKNISISNSVFNNMPLNSFNSLFSYTYIDNCSFINNINNIININSKEILSITNSVFSNNINSYFQLNNINSIYLYNISVSYNYFSKTFIELKNSLIDSSFINLVFNNNNYNNKNTFLIVSIINSNNETSVNLQDIEINNNENQILGGLLYINNKNRINNNIKLINIYSNINFTNNAINTFNSTIEIIDSILTSNMYSIKGYNNTITLAEGNISNIAKPFCNIINNIQYDCKVQDIMIPNNSSSGANTTKDDEMNRTAIILLSVLVPTSAFLFIFVVSLLSVLIYQKKKRLKVEDKLKDYPLPTFLENEIEMAVVAQN